MEQTSGAFRNKCDFLAIYCVFLVQLQNRIMKAERIESGLQRRSWSINRPDQEVARHVVFLLEGAGEAETENRSLHIEGPAVLWLGGMRAARFSVGAGASGYRAWAREEVVASAIGDHAESVALAFLAERDFALSLAGRNDLVAMLEGGMSGILAESRQPQTGSMLLASAFLRIFMVVLLRISGGFAAPGGVSGGGDDILRRFRQLVEMNFRSHWSVADYAKALSISTDRLHAICTAGIGSPPKRLVSERLAHEAAMRLERSSLGIEQIGHLLGFDDPAHFSNFFRRMRGMPPGRYRKLVAAALVAGSNAPGAGFADWP